MDMKKSYLLKKIVYKLATFVLMLALIPIPQMTVNAADESGRDISRLNEEQWYADAIGLPEMWEQLRWYDRQKVGVAIIDSGIRATHQELLDRINESLAWDVTTKSHNVTDDTGHGTRVSGVLAAKGVNIRGVSGTNVEIIPVKVTLPIDEISFYKRFKSMIKGFEYIEKILNDNEVPNLKVINISMSFHKTDILRDAIEEGVSIESVESDISYLRGIIGRLRSDYDILTVAAGGNFVMNDTPPDDFVVPSDYDEVLSVTATDKSGEHQRGFSYNENKDISAPGVSIIAANSKSDDAYDEKNGTEYATGTSFSTPIVSGIIANMRSVNPALTCDRITEILKSTATYLEPEFEDMSNGVSYVAHNGTSGLVNANLAMLEATKGLNKKDTPDSGVLEALSGVSKAPGALQGQTIYVETSSNQNLDTGNGTENNPYTQLATALSKTQDGDTVVIKGSAFVNDLGADSPYQRYPLIIDHAITIKAYDESVGATINLRRPGILINSDVTFKNINVLMAQKLHPYIIANGHNLTLENFTYDTSAQPVHIIAGGMTLPPVLVNNSPHVGNPCGNSTNITITGKTNLTHIYTGGFNEDYSGDVTVDVSGDITRINDNKFTVIKDSAVVSLEVYRDALNNILDTSKLALPDKDDGHGATGNLMVNTVGIRLKELDGDVKTTLNYKGRGAGIADGETIVKNVGHIIIEKDRFGLESGSVVDSNTDIVIKSGILDLAYAGDITVRNFTSESESNVVIVGTDNTLDIKGEVAGSTKLSVGSYQSFMNKSGKITDGHIYIKAPAKTSEIAFIFVEKSDYDTERTTVSCSKTNEGCAWIGYRPEGELEDIIVSSFSVDRAVEYESNVKGNLIEIGYEAEYSDDSGLGFIYDIPLLISVNGYKAKIQYDEAFLYYIVQLPNIELRIDVVDEAAFTVINNINKEDSDSSDVDLSIYPGIYDIEFTVPGDYTENGEPITGVTKLTMTGEAFIPVTDITGIPTSITKGDSVSLQPAIEPENASNAVIEWNVLDGVCDATITDGVLSAVNVGSFQLKATISGGGANKSDFTKLFNIVVSEKAPGDAGNPGEGGGTDSGDDGNPGDGGGTAPGDGGNPGDGGGTKPGDDGNPEDGGGTAPGDGGNPGDGGGTNPGDGDSKDQGNSGNPGGSNTGSGNSGTSSSTGNSGSGGEPVIKPPIKPVLTDISRAKITLSKNAYTYDKSKKTPGVSVKYNGKILKKNTDYAITYSSGRKNVGTYSVTIKGIGKYKGSKKLSFNINPKETTIKKIKALKKGFEIRWKKQTTLTSGYQLRYSTKSNMKSAKTVSITKNKLTSKKLTKLNSKNKYYFQIRTFSKVKGKTYYSGWSKAVKGGK